MREMKTCYRVVNVEPSRRLGDWPASTFGAPLGPGTTGVAPWDLATENKNLKPQESAAENTADIWSGKANQQKIHEPPPPPEVFWNGELVNPENSDKPLPRFITQEEADSAKNITGLAVAGGTLVALVAAGLIAFR